MSKNLNRKASVVMNLTVRFDLLDGQLTQDVEALREAVLEQLDRHFVAEVRDTARPDASGYEMIVFAADVADRATTRRVNVALTGIGMAPPRIEPHQRGAVASH